MNGWGNYSLNESAARLSGWAFLRISMISHPVPAEPADSGRRTIIILGHTRKDSPFQNYIGNEQVLRWPDVSVYIG
jgi:hypothetical protein